MGRSADLPRESGRTDGDDSGCPILHVDMDAFFASVEIRNNPALRGRPVVVGGGTRGVVAAASYEARRYGIRSAMAMSTALRMCPSAVVVPPDRAAYTETSEQVMRILREVTPLVQPVSVDEAFLDVSGATRAQGRPALIAEAIRAEVRRRTQLTCSVGIASTKFVAKLASARCKPDGLLVVPAGDVLSFLHPLPVTALWGVGARTVEQLHRIGVRTVSDLSVLPVDALTRALGDSAARHLHALSLGIDPRRVETDDVEKSISAEHTVDTDLTEAAQVRRLLLELADEVTRRVRDKGVLARTVGIKIRYADFSTVTRVRTLESWTDASRTVYETATALYDALELDRPRIRLVGVKCENLRAAGTIAEQLSFEDLPRPATGTRVEPNGGDASDRARADASGGSADSVVDAARRRFGPHALGYATLLKSGDAAPTRRNMPVPDDGGG